MKLINMICAAVLAFGFAACGDDKNEPEPVWGDGITVKKEVALAGATPQTLNIKASTTPTLTTDAAWLHIGEVKAGSASIYSVELQADANTTPETRTATVNITAGSDKAEVKVSQMPGDAIEIKSVEPSTQLNPMGGSIVIKYLSTAEPEVTLPAWITVAGEAGRAYEEGSVVLNYTRNAGQPREAEIVLSLGKGIQASVTVSQQVAAAQEISGKTAKELAAMMYAGVNIGNTMECPGGEGDWSMVVNEEYVAGLAAMGFNAVRIPCAWNSHATDGVIDPAWLARVDEVVGWVIGNGMFAMVNTHWDGGWIEGDGCTKGYDEALGAKFGSYWKQIAEQLNHYDQNLLFSAMNEPPVEEATTTSKKRGIDAIMKYEQIMLDAVRATGGNNLDRVLVMSVPNTNIELAVWENYFHMPTDVVADRLMVEAHYYGPYNFNMMEKDENWGKMAYYWGKDNHVAGSDRNSTWGEEDYVFDQMQILKTNFVDKGYPGLIGEYCVCVERFGVAGLDKEKHQASLYDWNRVVTLEAKNAGCVPFFWETGGHIDRRNGTVKNGRSYQLEGVFAGAAAGHYPF